MADTVSASGELPAPISFPHMPKPQPGPRFDRTRFDERSAQLVGLLSFLSAQGCDAFSTAPATQQEPVLFLLYDLAREVRELVMGADQEASA
ncbi:hypothetical protein [Aquariibacter albus]|uniref:DUF3077 domain-containing protein n=1 Tax=Aquariibacter albus TaxID=2759899 RepID=A0A839HG56_9BURK|nr:hypothetical protein [Aquariibacter albus]MBB1160965.1 hypothetical protein [Aquariibacter albus]